MVSADMAVSQAQYSTIVLGMCVVPAWSPVLLPASRAVGVRRGARRNFCNTCPVCWLQEGSGSTGQRVSRTCTPVALVLETTVLLRCPQARIWRSVVKRDVGRCVLLVARLPGDTRQGLGFASESGSQTQ